MHRIYAAPGIVYLLLLIAAGVVSLAQSRAGALSLKAMAVSIAGLSILELGTIVCIWAGFVLAGGPDGRFLSRDALLFGGIGTVLALLAVLFSLRLLSMPGAWAVLFLAPAVITVSARAARAWPVALAAFSAGPVLCLFIIVGLWVRHELGVLG